jgi:ribosomal protein L7/L12
MSNITPKTPSFVLGYWRPWKENSNLIDSYLDYVKDKSLIKYGADTVGMYINQASTKQIKAINELGNDIGRGMNILSDELTEISDTLSDINQTLISLNRNTDIQIEQQKLSNLLLQNISELLRVPDSEKERQHSIELGIKFFVNAKKDPDLYADALEEFLKAETLMKQDYFVLHRIGCIYLYVEKYINLEKALDYFIKAAKYVSVESDPSAMRLINLLNGNSESLDASKIGFNIMLLEAGADKLVVVKVIKDNTKLSLKDAMAAVNNAPHLIEINIALEKAKLFCKLLEDAGAKVSIAKGDKLNLSKTEPLAEIEKVAADSYEKAAFSAYVLGRFQDAMNYQTKVVNLNPIPQNRFLLAKYQTRNGNIKDAIENLDKCINEKPIYAIAAFKEIDLVNDKEVLNLIAKKNENINNKISRLIEKWKTIDSTKANEVIVKLTELSKKSYEIKIADFNKYENEGNEIDVSVKDLAAKIDLLISEIRSSKYLTFDANRISGIIKDLKYSKDLPLEKMEAVYDDLKTELEKDKLKIGSKYDGGIVFYIDETGRHGLVCADKDFGQAIWGDVVAVGAKKNKIGHGVENTKKIVELGSFAIKKSIVKSGWFTTKTVEEKISVNTAARLCLEANYNGFCDWYLPTINELALIYNKLYKIKLGSFKSAIYWSSSEFDDVNALYFHFRNGYSDTYNKKNNIYVLAVRAF